MHMEQQQQQNTHTHTYTINTCAGPPSGLLLTEIKDPSVGNPELKGSHLKPGVGQNIAMHASSTARVFFLELISTFPVQHSPSFFPKISPELFLYELWLTQVSVSAHKIKSVTMLVVTDNWCRFLCWVPTEYKWVPKQVLLCSGLLWWSLCEMLRELL